MTRLPKRERLRSKLASASWDELAVRDAILETELPASSKLVLLAVVSHRCSDSPTPVVSVRRLAWLASVNKDTPARVVAALEREGLLRVSRSNGRAAACFDLTSLRAALARLLSEPEGQSLSEQRGQPTHPQTDLPLSLQTRAAVPANETRPPESVRTEGIQGTDQGTDQGTLPRSDAPRPPRKQAARRKKTCPAPKPKSKAEPEHTAEQRAANAAVTKAFYEAFERKTGSKPADWNGKQGNAVYSLLGKLRWDVDLACQRITNALFSEWGGATSIATIAADPDRFAVLNRKGGKPSGPKQPNDTRPGGWCPTIERPEAAP